MGEHRVRVHVLGQSPAPFGRAALGGGWPERVVARRRSTPGATGTRSASWAPAGADSPSPRTRTMSVPDCAERSSTETRSAVRVPRVSAADARGGSAGRAGGTLDWVRGGGGVDGDGVGRGAAGAAAGFGDAACGGVGVADRGGRTEGGGVGKSERSGASGAFATAGRTTRGGGAGSDGGRTGFALSVFAGGGGIETTPVFSRSSAAERASASARRSSPPLSAASAARRSQRSDSAESPCFHSALAVCSARMTSPESVSEAAGNSVPMSMMFRPRSLAPEARVTV